ncbi:protein ALP1-like [Salvia divinorum]|uniref:Protein ALP1-like n=1 Tax=Salvia divinorum TaxID=28513 RepID=A0ABD1HUD3_SALDI
MTAVTVGGNGLRMMQGCLGALDGTYINVWMPIADTPHYRNRKDHLDSECLEIVTWSRQRSKLSKAHKVSKLGAK